MVAITRTLYTFLTFFVDKFEKFSLILIISLIFSLEACTYNQPIGLGNELENGLVL